MKSGPLDTLAALIVRRRGAALALLTLLAVASGVGIVRLESNFSPDDLFGAVGDQKEVSREFKETYGNTDNVVLLVVQADDVLEPAPLAYLHQLSQHFKEQPYTARAASITLVPIPRRKGPPRTEISPGGLARDIATGVLELDPVIQGPDAEVGPDQSQALRDGLAEIPMMEGRLISKDRTTAVLAVALVNFITKNDQIAPVIEDMEEYVAAHPPPAGVEVQLAGLPFMRTTLIRKVSADQKTLFPAAMAVCLLLLFATFRWFPAVLLPTIAISISALGIVGTMGWVGEPINIINNIVPVLILIIGLTDCIHFVNRYGEGLAAGASRTAASTMAARAMIVALFLTTFTTAVGFASLAVSQLDILRGFGIAAAGGVIIAYIVSIGLLAPALTYIPEPNRKITDPEEGKLENIIAPMVERVIDYRIVVVLVSAALLAASLAGAQVLEPDNRVSHQYDPDDEVYKSIRLLEDKLGGVRPMEVELYSDTPDRFTDPEVLNAVDRVAAWAVKRDIVIEAASYADLLRQAWRLATGDPKVETAPFGERTEVRTLASMLELGGENPLGRYANEKRTRMRLSLQLRDAGSRAILAFSKDLEDQLENELGGQDDIEWRFAGEGYVSARGLTVVTRDLLSSLSLAIVVIFVFMTVLLRSLRLGLISIPPNALPLVATMAYMNARGIPLNTATAIIFSVSIGLAVDGTIHVLVRFREEIRRGKDKRGALLGAARGTGKAVVVSYLSLIIGFAAFQLSEFVPVRKFGELVSITIFGCLISTLVLLPALVAMFWKSPDKPRPRRPSREYVVAGPAAAASDDTAKE